jgi:hypothetical protein
VFYCIILLQVVIALGKPNVSNNTLWASQKNNRRSYIGQPYNPKRQCCKTTLNHNRFDLKSHFFADTQVILFAPGVHMDPNIFESPKEFFPERFLNPEKTAFFKSKYVLTFGHGKRKCIGEILTK